MGGLVTHARNTRSDFSGPTPLFLGLFKQLDSSFMTGVPCSGSLPKASHTEPSTTVIDGSPLKSRLKRGKFWSVKSSLMAHRKYSAVEWGMGVVRAQQGERSYNHYYRHRRHGSHRCFAVVATLY